MYPCRHVFPTFFMFTPKIFVEDSHVDVHICQLGWFNQLTRFPVIEGGIGLSPI